MFRESTARLLVPAIRSALQKRAQSVVSGPPTKSISTAEKVFLGGGMILSLTVVPAWVVYHIKEYKGEK